MGAPAIAVLLGGEDSPHLSIEVVGYEHPDVAEPQGFDLLECCAHASADPVVADFALSMRVMELLDLRGYLAEINSGNGPPATFSLAGGLLGLSFAPSRRGPVLCAVQLKSVDASHVRLEFMITLEPNDITRALGDLDRLPAAF